MKKTAYLLLFFLLPFFSCKKYELEKGTLPDQFVGKWLQISSQHDPYSDYKVSIDYFQADKGYQYHVYNYARPFHKDTWDTFKEDEAHDRMEICGDTLFHEYYRKREKNPVVLNQIVTSPTPIDTSILIIAGKDSLFVDFYMDILPGYDNQYPIYRYYKIRE